MSIFKNGCSCTLSSVICIVQKYVCHHHHQSALGHVIHLITILCLFWIHLLFYAGRIMMMFQNSLSQLCLFNCGNVWFVFIVLFEVSFVRSGDGEHSVLSPCHFLRCYWPARSVEWCTISLPRSVRVVHHLTKSVWVVHHFFTQVSWSDVPFLCPGQL